jgi:hypothetical protein
MWKRLFLIVWVSLAFFVAFGQHPNISYRSDTSITTHIEGYVNDTVIIESKITAKCPIKLIASNPDYKVVSYKVMWTCPEADYMAVQGEFITKDVMKHFGGSNHTLLIFDVLTVNPKGVHYWIKGRYYAVLDEAILHYKKQKQ